MASMKFKDLAEKFKNIPPESMVFFIYGEKEVEGEVNIDDVVVMRDGPDYAQVLVCCSIDDYSKHPLKDDRPPRKEGYYDHYYDEALPF